MRSWNVKLKFKNAEDKLACFETLKKQREAFNAASKVGFDIFQRVKKIPPFLLHNKFYTKFRESNPDIPAQITIKAIQEVTARYSTIRSNKQKISAPVNKKGLSTELDSRCSRLDFDKREISIVRAGGPRIKATFEVYDAIPKTWELVGPMIFARDGEIYLTLRFNEPTKALINESVIGVDLGVNRVAATSCGKIFKAENYNASKRRLRHLKRCLRSKNTKTAKRHLKKVRRKERNKSCDFVHHISNALLNLGAGTLVLEDLTKLKESSAKKNRKNFGVKNGGRINNKVSQVPFYALKKTLEYKAQARGQRVVTVDPAYTSKTDSRTGKIEGLRVGCRFYGIDGVVLDADVNAAINIAKRYKLPGQYSNGLDGQVVVIRPYAARNSFSRKKLRAASPRL